MWKMLERERLDMIFFILTNILTETSIVLSAGDKAQALLEEAFGENHVDKEASDREQCMILKNVVSRKKQFLPALVDAIQH